LAFWRGTARALARTWLPHGRRPLGMHPQDASRRRGGAASPARAARSTHVLPSPCFSRDSCVRRAAFAQAVCGSGGRRAAGAKKRAALCDLTNGGAAAVRLHGARAKVRAATSPALPAFQFV
jgi:hypothetical protein